MKKWSAPSKGSRAYCLFTTVEVSQIFCPPSPNLVAMATSLVSQKCANFHIVIIHGKGPIIILILCYLFKRSALRNEGVLHSLACVITFNTSRSLIYIEPIQQHF